MIMPTKPAAMPIHWIRISRCGFTFLTLWQPLKISTSPQAQIKSDSTISSVSVCFR